MKIKIEGLIKSYEGMRVLDQINIDLNGSNVVAFIGPSGSGKSTFLRMIAGLEPLDEGTIELNGLTLSKDTIEGYRKKIGFVFQDHNLFNHLSLYENVALVLEKVHGLEASTFGTGLLERFERFGLQDHIHKKPHQVSGGQGQRASIVRALSINPDVILLDEPTSSLDPILTYEVLMAIEQLVEEGKNVILVTHEIGFAKKVADYVFYMEDGKIVEQGKDILRQPNTEALKNFLSRVLRFEESI